MCEPELTAENQGLLCAQGGHSNSPSCLWEPQTVTYLTFRPGVTWEGNFSFSKAGGGRCRDLRGRASPREEPQGLSSGTRV